MTYKIALLDDEIDFLKKLSSCFQDYPQIETDYFIDPNELIKQIRKYDCVYVDYEMDQMTAFDFFEQTKQMKYLKIIITKYDHVVYKSFDYNIFDFVRKNNLKEDMSNKVGRLLKRLEEDHRCLIVSSFNQILTLPYETIQYIHTVYIQRKTMLLFIVIRNIRFVQHLRILKRR